MKILVGSTNAWHDSNAVGNTLSNWFSNQPDMEFANLYSRSEMPSNKVCEKYFRITEQQMLKNIFTPEKIGAEFEYAFSQESQPVKSNAGSNERNLINFVKKHNLKPVYMLSQALWNSGLWINKRLTEFISGFSPDIFFSFATEPIVLKKRMELVKKLSNAKTVLFVADDVYSVFKEDKNKQLTEDFAWCIQNADLLYGASDELCKEYQSIFSKEFHLLYKGCDILPVNEEKDNGKIKLVYAGNLFYGRDKTLAQLVKAMKEVNEIGQKKLELDIYTASPVSEEMSAILNSDGVSRIIGKRPYSEVTQAMHNADFVLHVESFEPEEIKKVRLSYSTKITDCLQSGSCPLAIGPDGIASINYMKKVDGAVVITNTNELKEVLSNYSTSYSKIKENAVLTNSYAKMHHDIKVVKESIDKDFKTILKE